MDFFGFIITAIVLLAIGLPVAIIVMFWITRNKTNQLQQQLDELRVQVVALAAGPVAGKEAQSEIVNPISASDTVVSEEPPEPEAQWESPPVAASSIPPAAASVTHDPGPRAKNPVDHFEDLLRRIGNAWFDTRIRRALAPGAATHATLEKMVAMDTTDSGRYRYRTHGIQALSRIK